MVKRKKRSTNTTKTRPPKTPAEAERMLTALAYELAEKQLRDGTASSQVINHFLKMGTGREKLERDNLTQDVKLKEAKTEAIESAKRTEEMMAEALSAMRQYEGSLDDEDI